MTRSAATPPDPPGLLDARRRHRREGGGARRPRSGLGRPSVHVKSSPVDVVTAVDTACEELIVGRLLAARPDDGVLGEEGSSRTGVQRGPLGRRPDRRDGQLPLRLPGLRGVDRGRGRRAGPGGGRPQRRHGGVVHRHRGGGAHLARRAATEPEPAWPGAARVAGADPGGHRVRLPGGAAAGAGRRRRRAPAAGPRHPPGGERGAGPVLGRRRAGGRLLRAGLNPGTTRPGRWSRRRPAWSSPACRAARSPSRWRSSRPPSIAGKFVGLLAALHQA